MISLYSRNFVCVFGIILINMERGEEIVDMFMCFRDVSGLEVAILRRSERKDKGTKNSK